MFWKLIFVIFVLTYQDLLENFARKKWRKKLSQFLTSFFTPFLTSFFTPFLTSFFTSFFTWFFTSSFSIGYAITPKFLIIENKKLPLIDDGTYIPSKTSKICNIDIEMYNKDVWIENREKILDGIYRTRNGHILVAVQNYNTQPYKVPDKITFDEIEQINTINETLQETSYPKFDRLNELMKMTNLNHIEEDTREDIWKIIIYSSESIYVTQRSLAMYKSNRAWDYPRIRESNQFKITRIARKKPRNLPRRDTEIITKRNYSTFTISVQLTPVDCTQKR